MGHHVHTCTDGENMQYILSSLQDRLWTKPATLVVCGSTLLCSLYLTPPPLQQRRVIRLRRRSPSCPYKCSLLLPCGFQIRMLRASCDGESRSQTKQAQKTIGRHHLGPDARETALGNSLIAMVVIYRGYETATNIPLTPSDTCSLPSIALLLTTRKI